MARGSCAIDDCPNQDGCTDQLPEEYDSFAESFCLDADWQSEAEWLLHCLNYGDLDWKECRGSCENEIAFYDDNNRTAWCIEEKDYEKYTFNRITEEEETRSMTITPSSALHTVAG